MRPNSRTVTLFRDNPRSAELEQIRGLAYTGIRARKRADCAQGTDLPPAASLDLRHVTPVGSDLDVSDEGYVKRVDLLHLILHHRGK